MRCVAAIALATLLALPACTSGGDDGGAASLDSTGSFGALQMERGANSELPELADGKAVLNAVFARYSGLEAEDALELLGVGRAGPETDDCALVGGQAPVYPQPDAIVELLDVGDLHVGVAGSRTRLSARMFPELGSLVAGAFYAGHAELAEARADVDEYQVLATGGAEVAPFEVVAVAPPAPSGVVVDGFVPPEEPVVGRDRDLEILWDAGDPRDRLDVTLAAGSTAIECAARDDGMITVPADLVAQLDADADARLVLRRVRVQPFDAPGLDVAWADLVATRTIPLRVR
ncbi:MAG: hypothetical protein ACODAU_05305 [Myxococcota bacterium]